MSDVRHQSGWDPNRRALYTRPVMVPAGRDAPIAPSQPGAIGPEDGQLVKLPGGNFRPPGSVPFDQIGDANIAPNTTATLLQIVIPSGQRFVLDKLGFHADDGAALGYLTWTIVFNGERVAGYGGVPSAVGSLRNPTQIGSVFYAIGDSSTLLVNGTASASAVITYRYAAHGVGWFYADTRGNG